MIDLYPIRVESSPKILLWFEKISRSSIVSVPGKRTISRNDRFHWKFHCNAVKQNAFDFLILILNLL